MNDDIDINTLDVQAWRCRVAGPRNQTIKGLHSGAST
jgi:hypothetical protein